MTSPQRSVRASRKLADRLRSHAAGRRALAVVRRARPGAVAVRGAARSAAGRFDALALPARAAVGRRAVASRRRDLERGVAALGPVRADARLVTLVADHLPAPSGLEVERASFADGSGDLLAFAAPTTTPLEPGWLARLAAALPSEGGLAAPVAVHPERSGWSARPWDLTVRSSGIDVRIGVDGAPEAVGHRPTGSAATGSAATGGGAEAAAGADETVLAVGPAAFVVDRRSFEAVGGFDDIALGDPCDGTTSGDPEAAIIDLCLRLRAMGRSVVVVPEVVVVDARPSGRTRRGAPPAVAPGAWRSVVDRHGPALWREARRRAGQPPSPLRFAITVASPSAKVVDRWGDAHLANDLARALGRLGHEAIVRPLDAADALATRAADVHLVVRGLAPVRRTPGQRQVIWVISHPDEITVEECDAADLVLVASAPFAAALAERTTTPVEVFLQATDPERFRPRTPDPAWAHPVTVVAKTRGVLRPIVADALAAGVSPAIFGSGWEEFGLAGLVVADHVANEDLPLVYASAGVVLNDHWADMAREGFVSNRIFDASAAGAPVISDVMPEVARLFGDAVPMASGPDELRALLAAVVADPASAKARAARAREVVLAGHTLDHRAVTLLGLLATPPELDDGSVGSSDP